MTEVAQPRLPHRVLLGEAVLLLWLPMLLLASATGCAKGDVECADGACPVGYRCVAATGLCEVQSSGPALQTSLFGTIAAIDEPLSAPIVIGFAKDRQSLAVIDGTKVSFLAGPAANSSQQPAGQASAAIRGEDDNIHIAWVRDADHTLWHAHGRGGAWQVDQVDVAKSGTVARPIAIGWWQGQPVIAWRAGDAATVRVGRHLANNSWSIKDLPPPPPPRKGAPATTDMGRSLALATPSSGLTIATYDATHGDVLVSVDSGSGWSTARLAGSDPATGMDTGDMGSPLALAVGPDGELVLAYRNASRSTVMLARAAKGVVSHEVVATGTVPGPFGTEQRDWIGSNLSLAVRSDGQAALAWSNGSRWSIELALQKPAGGFARSQPPGQLLGKGKQLWPMLSGGSAIWLSWVAVDASRGPTGSRVVQWAVPAEAWK